MRRRPLWYTLLALTSALVNVRFGHCEAVTPEMRGGDPRLNSKITFKQPRVYLLDLLERLSAVSGVTLLAGARDGAEDQQVTVCLDNVPLADAMNALWSLLSYKNAEYSWVREGMPGNYRYSLVRPLGAQRLAARLQNMCQEVFEEQVHTLLEAAQMAPDQRKSFLAGKTLELYSGDNGLRDAAIQSDRKWAGLKTFAESLSQERQLAVLRGTEKVRIPVGELSDGGRAFVRSVWSSIGPNARRRAPDGTWQPFPEPTWIQFEASRRDSNDIAPMLVIPIEGLGAYAYVGGVPLEKAARRKIADLWMQPGDSLNDDAVMKQVDASKKLFIAPIKNRVLEERLRQLSHGSQISLIARLPIKQEKDPGDPDGKSVGVALESMAANPPYVQTKWRNGLLLVSYPTWFWDEDSIVPARVVRSLRDAEAAQGGLLNLENLATTVTLLSRDQLLNLVDEFPVMANAYAWYDVLRMYGSSPLVAKGLRSEAGLELSEDVLARLRSSTYIRKYLARQDNPAFNAVRIVEEEHTDRKPISREITIGFVTQDKKWVPVIGFTYEAHKAE